MAVITGFGMVGGTTRYGFFDDFLGGTITGSVTGASENSGTAAIVASKEGGIVGLITGATDTNRSQIVVGLNYKAASGGPLVMEASVAPITNLTGQQIFVGWTDLNTIEAPFTISGTTLTSNATDAVGLLWSSAATDATHWYFVSVKTDADGAVTLTTAPAVAAGVFQAVRVEIDKDGNAAAFVNGVQVGSTNLSTSTGQTWRTNALSPSVLLTPYVGNETLTGSAARTTYVDYLYVQAGRAS